MDVRSAPAPGDGEDPFESMLQQVRRYMLADERKKEARAQLKRATEAKDAQVAAAHTLATEVVGRHNVWMGCGDMLIRVSKPAAKAMVEADTQRAARDQSFQRELVKHNAKLAKAARQALGLAPGTAL